MIAKGDSRIRASDVGKGLDDLEVNKAKLEIMSDDDILIATDNLFTKVVNLLSERGKKDYAPVAQLRTKWLFIVRDHVKKQFNLLANPVEP